MPITDYPANPRVRRPSATPIHPRLYTAIAAPRPRYAKAIADLQGLKPSFAAIDAAGPDNAARWINPWIPVFDGMLIYGFLVSRRPRQFVEIGSGTSTAFARRAIHDHDLPTKIVSIDPHPRSDIDQLCDTVLRSPLEDADLALFDSLDSRDIVFCDNSHRSYQSSDVTVFMTEVLASLQGSGTLIGVHDIFLPYDYPESWLDRLYNEQYLLVGHILRGLDIIFAGYFAATDDELRARLNDIAMDTAAEQGSLTAGSFWFKS